MTQDDHPRRGPITDPVLIEINRITEILMAAWAKAEPEHGVTLHPVSYIATFVDMAKAIVEDSKQTTDSACTTRGDVKRTADGLASFGDRLDKLTNETLDLARLHVEQMAIERDKLKASLREALELASQVVAECEPELRRVGYEVGGLEASIARLRKETV